MESSDILGIGEGFPRPNAVDAEAEPRQLVNTGLLRAGTCVVKEVEGALCSLDLQQEQPSVVAADTCAEQTKSTVTAARADDLFNLDAGYGAAGNMECIDLDLLMGGSAPPSPSHADAQAPQPQQQLPVDAATCQPGQPLDGAWGPFVASQPCPEVASHLPETTKPAVLSDDMVVLPGAERRANASSEWAGVGTVTEVKDLNMANLLWAPGVEELAGMALATTGSPEVGSANFSDWEPPLLDEGVAAGSPKRVDVIATPCLSPQADLLTPELPPECPESPSESMNLTPQTKSMNLLQMGTGGGASAALNTATPSRVAGESPRTSVNGATPRRSAMFTPRKAGKGKEENSSLIKNRTPKKEPVTQKVDLPTEQGGTRFLLKCKGRWRLRSAPNLSSRVVGTIGAGSIVVGIPVPCKLSAASQNVENENEDADTKSDLKSPWLRILHFESQSSSGVQLRKPDSDELFCYRRNKQGHGLYEIGVEKIDELRTLHGEEPQNQVQDTSATWKLLGAAEQFTKAISDWSLPSTWWRLDAACTAVEHAPKEKPADKVFERRQREQLQGAARDAAAQLSSLAAWLKL